MQEHSSEVIQRSINHVETTNGWAHNPEVLDGPTEPNGRSHTSAMQEHSGEVMERGVIHVETATCRAHSPEVLDGPEEPNGRCHAFGTRDREQEVFDGHRKPQDVQTDSSVVIETLFMCVFVCAFCTCAGMCAFQPKPADLEEPAAPDDCPAPEEPAAPVQTKPSDLEVLAAPDVSAAPEKPASPVKPKPADLEEPEAPVESAALDETARLESGKARRGGGATWAFTRGHGGR